MPNFILSRTYRVPGRKRLLDETLQSRNPKTVNGIYDSWWADPNTVSIQLIERKTDSTELIREDSRPQPGT
jgi:hypothetical protein